MNEVGVDMLNMDMEVVKNLAGRVVVKNISGTRKDKEQFLVSIGPDKNDPENRSLPVSLKCWRKNGDEADQDGFIRVDLVRRTNTSFAKEGRRALESGVFFQMTKDDKSGVVDSKHFFETMFVLLAEAKKFATELAMKDFANSEEDK